MGIRLYIDSVIRDRKTGLTVNIVSFVLLIFSVFYRIGVKFVDWGYRWGFKKKVKVSLPVISVGNVTVGGTGKTPFSIFLADYFVAKGLKPAILTRGYGQDENVMMKDELPEVPIIVGQNRVRSALRAAEFNRDLVILDDGFQHRRLERQMNILLVDTKSFPGNKRLLPAGIYREPIDAVRRADIFVLTKIDEAGRDRKEEVSDILKKYSPGTPVIGVCHSPACLNDVTGAAYAIEYMQGKRILLISAIADPGYFKFIIQKNGGMVLSETVFADHYQYKQGDVNKLGIDCLKNNIDMVITTKKDFVKIRKLDISEIEEKIFILNINIEVIEGKETLIAGLNSFINS